MCEGQYTKNNCTVLCIGKRVGETVHLETTALYFVLERESARDSTPRTTALYFVLERECEYIQYIIIPINLKNKHPD